MATGIRVTGAKELSQRLMNGPLYSKAAQKELTRLALRNVSGGIQRRLRATAPVRTGQLRRSMRVYVPKGRRLALHIEGTHYMVPLNARNGFLGKELNSLPRNVRSEISRLLTANL